MMSGIRLYHLQFFLWMLPITQLQPAGGTCLPHSKTCNGCDKNYTCYLPDGSFMADIPKEVQNLTIYIEQSTYLGQKYFSHFKDLRHLSIHGNISDFEIHTFSYNGLLESLQVFTGSFRTLPPLFGTKNKLKLLRLHDTKIEYFPFELLQETIFLEELNFSYNVYVKFHNETGAKMIHLRETLRQLEVVTLYLIIPRLSNEFLDGFSNVRQLSLASCSVYENISFINFERLQVLDLSDIMPFKNCPNSAKYMFTQMPSSLASLKLEGWGKWGKLANSIWDITPECKLTNEAFQGLKSLFSLRVLSMKYCKGAIEQYLPNALFQGFYSLAVLDLEFCGLIDIARAFNSDGSGGLGRPFATNIISLKLSHNFLYKIPYTSGRQHPNFSTVKELFLDGNHLTNLSPWTHCLVYPSMETLSLSNNQLEDINGTCLRIKHLYLANNQLKKNWSSNLMILKSLRNLETLDLNGNFLGQLDEDMFAKASCLKILLLSYNNISYIPSGIFLQNKQLKVIDLSCNSLSQLDVETFTGLSRLERLSLSTNLFQRLDEAFVEYLTKSDRLKYLELNGNSWSCDCGLLYFQKMLSTSEFIEDREMLRCHSKAHNGELIIDYIDDPWQCTWSYPLLYAFISLCSMAVAATMAFSCYKYRFYVCNIRIVARAVRSQLRQMKVENDCVYDAFVSFNQACQRDTEWVVNILVPAIENCGDKSLKLYIEPRDAAVGTSQYTERSEALETSRKVIIVLSNSYVESCYCLGEAELAGYEMLGSKFYQPNRIVVLVLEELRVNFIKPPISSLLLQQVLMVKQADTKAQNYVIDQVRRFLEPPKLVYRKTAASVRHQISQRVELEPL